MLSGVLGVISSVLLVIALITLMFGGIGIVNILLVSVTERIREIGIRKAFRRKEEDIVFQFIMESIYNDRNQRINRYIDRRNIWVL
jgi:putative ABC transport system permease protein